MKTAVSDALCRIRKTVHFTIKWLVTATVVGVLGGAFGTLFLFGIRYAGIWREAKPWLVYLLPVAGLLIVGLYRLSKQSPDLGTNEVLDAVNTGKRLPAAMAPLILVSTVVTHLFGGSAGREGAALQLGGSIGTTVGRILRFDEADMRLTVLMGMSAVFSALFGTPLAATFFALEVARIGTMYYAAIAPCLVSSLVAFKLAKLAGFSAVAFDLVGAATLTPAHAAETALLAAVCAVVSIVFCVVMHGVSHGFHRVFPNPYVRIFVGGALVVGLTALVGTRDYNGVGANVLSAALAGSARPEAFALKLLFTAVTLGCGFKGGEIVPCFFVGATFGCVIAPLIGLTPAFGAAIGLVALFCGITNCPVSSLFLAIELFGGQCIPLFGLTVAVSYVLSGRFSVYTTQQFLFSKLRAERIDPQQKTA